MHVHAFDDIRSKGVISLYNTLHNEPLHGPLKNTYTFLTNFKDVDAQVSVIFGVAQLNLANIFSQILRVDHERFVAQYLRHTINKSEELG